MLRSFIVTGAVGIGSLGLNASAQETAALWDDTRSSLSQQETNIGLKLTVPFGGGSLEAGPEGRVRLSLAMDFGSTGNQLRMDGFAKPDLSIGLTTGGELFYTAGDAWFTQTDLNLIMRADSDDTEGTEEKKGGNAGLIVGGVLVAGGLLAVAASEFEDGVEDTVGCIIDAITGVRTCQ